VPVHWEHPLQTTFEATIASFGYRTRRNLRNAMRRVAKNNWTFVPEMTAAQLGEAVEQLAEDSTHPFSKEIVANRTRLATMGSGGFAMGLTDANGRWLSCMAGQRRAGVADTFWQSNARGIRTDTLCIAMRSLFMCEEIRRGSQLVRYIGGTCPLMQHCCTAGGSTQTLIVRRGPRMRLIQALAGSSIASAGHPLRLHFAKGAEPGACQG